MFALLAPPQAELKLDYLESIVKEVISTNTSQQELYWPSDSDVIAAFEVFDQEGLGYIPVQQLKRFLLQAQLGFRDEKECECAFLERILYIIVLLLQWSN